MLVVGPHDHSEMWDLPTMVLFVVKPQLQALECPYMSSESWQIAEDDSRQEGLQASLCSWEVEPGPVTDPQEQELNLTHIPPKCGRATAKREALASLAFLEEKLSQLRDMPHEGQPREKWNIALGFR